MLLIGPLSSPHVRFCLLQLATAVQCATNVSQMAADGARLLGPAYLVARTRQPLRPSAWDRRGFMTNVLIAINSAVASALIGLPIASGASRMMVLLSAKKTLLWAARKRKSVTARVFRNAATV